MARQYNHSAVEKKWNKYWKEHPVNVDDGKKENIIVWICFLTLQVPDFM